MTTRTVNKSLLKELIKKKGLERIAVDADCSASLLQKLASEKYDGLPSIRKIDGICFATETKIDELFPVCETGQKAS